MGLINQKTDLKSLKFGKDRIGGGNSKQPYIQTPIPEKVGEFGFLNEDFILRGGSKAVTDSALDVVRLGKYFTDIRNPSGLLFIAKQNLLSRTAVRTQAARTRLLNEGVYTPLSTLAEAAGVAFGLHVNKQGLNPFDGVGSLTTYTDVVNPALGEVFSIVNEDRNRLVLLTNSKINNNISVNPLTGISPLPTNVLSYPGGPGSILGIGRTNIKFADQRTGLNNPELKNSGFFGKVSGFNLFNISNVLSLINTLQTPKHDYSVFKKPITNINGKLLLGASTKWSEYFTPITAEKNGFTEQGKIDSNTRQIGQLDNPDSTLSTNFIPGIASENQTFTYTQDDLNNLTKFSTGNNSPNPSLIGSSIIGGTVGVGDFRAFLRKNLDGADKVLPIAPNYTEKNIEKRVNLGDPGDAKGKNLVSYTNGSYKGAASKGSYDIINHTKILPTDGLGSNATFPDERNDLVKFAISIIDTKQNQTFHLHFRAFLNQISDNFTADWSATKYIGRGENFYTYNGFDRKVSLSWTVAAQSKIELIPMYKKLNYLASACAPNYSGNGYMQGNIAMLTVGGYFYNQPGIITGFNYSMNDDAATWEIGINDEGEYDSSVKELPHLIKVEGFNFIPIHTFVPRLVQNIEAGTKERYIALQAGTSNYDSNE